jgi:hypothetical protein
MSTPRTAHLAAGPACLHRGRRTLASVGGCVRARLQTAASRWARRVKLKVVKLKVVSQECQMSSDDVAPCRGSLEVLLAGDLVAGVPGASFQVYSPGNSSPAV